MLSEHFRLSITPLFSMSIYATRSNYICCNALLVIPIIKVPIYRSMLKALIFHVGPL